MNHFPTTDSLASIHRGDPGFWYSGDPEADMEAAERDEYLASVASTEPVADEDR